MELDQWIIKRNSGEVVSEHIAVKQFMTMRYEQGVGLVPVEAGRQEKDTLNELERKELLNLAVAAEKYFRFPQDLEWACEDGVFYLVQARPITALYPICVVADEGGDSALRGIPASAGILERSVKIVMRPEEGSKLRDGNLLVCYVYRSLLDDTVFKK